MSEGIDPFIFVYGTLMQGYRAHAYLKGAEYVGPGKVRGALYDVGHPAWIRGGTNPIHGEVYMLPVPDAMAMLRQMDHYESTVTGLFTRIRTDVELPNDKIAAWAYMYTRLPITSVAKFVPSGSWRQYHPPA